MKTKITEISEKSVSARFVFDEHVLRRTYQVVSDSNIVKDDDYNAYHGSILGGGGWALEKKDDESLVEYIRRQWKKERARLVRDEGAAALFKSQCTWG